MKNDGLKHEDEMIHFIDNKTIDELSINLSNFVKTLYGIVDPGRTFYCNYTTEFIKPDFVITYMGRKKYISMKSGTSTIVHSEKLESFIPFLRSLKVSEETLKTILLFHYGDGTVNGTGLRRYTGDQVRYAFRERIKRANDELNSNADLLILFAERVLFQGVDPNAHNADCIYHGTYENGVYATKKQIIKRFNRCDYNKDPMNNIHIGPFFLKPRARYAGMEVTNPKERERIEVYWPSIKDDLVYISHKYQAYTPMRHRNYEE